MRAVPRAAGPTNVSWMGPAPPITLLPVLRLFGNVGHSTDAQRCGASKRQTRSGCNRLGRPTNVMPAFLAPTTAATGDLIHPIDNGRSIWAFPRPRKHWLAVLFRSQGLRLR